jgi:hypothetical protein
MHDQEARQYLVGRISVTRQKVTLAKAFLVDLSKSVTDSVVLIQRLRDHMDSNMPSEVVLHPSVDPIPVLDKAADSISWRLAGCEALWELIHSNMLMPAAEALVMTTDRLSWTTVVRNSGGTSAGWGFDEYSLVVPQKVARPPSLDSMPEQLLTNHDLFIREINIVNMHPQVEAALQEAVRCFRFELFTASLAMLGKASEGAWLELGEALLKSVPSTDQSKVERQRKSLENPNVGIGKKIEEVIALYERQDIFQRVAEVSGVKLQELRTSAIWSDAVRDSRNSIHFGVEPAMANTYEKVAALLVGAVPNFRILYRLKNAANAI